MAAACHTGKGSIIRIMKNLEKMGFVEIAHRGIFSRSNDVKLTIENGLKKCRPSSGEICAGNTPQGTRGESIEGTHSETPTRTHSESCGTHGETPHIDKRFKYQDLNLKTREKGTQNETPRVSSKEIAPADVTAGRLMPNSGCAGSARKEGMAEGAQLDIEDYCLWQDFKLDFSGCYPWLQLVRVQNHLLIRGLGRMGEDILVKAWDEVKAWFAARGVVVEKVGQSQRFSGEIIIKEAV